MRFDRKRVNRLLGASDSGKLNNILQRMEGEEFDQIWIWMAPNVRGCEWLFLADHAAEGIFGKDIPAEFK
ncbi:MAG: hypothetical protein WDM78_17205 [Puia sp.]